MQEASDRVDRIIPERSGKYNEVLHLIIHNPEKLNALSTVMQIEFIEFLKEAAGDDSIHVIIIRGYGDKAFSSGGQLDNLVELTDEAGQEAMYQRGVEIRETIASMYKPVVAAVNGFCIGGGFEIAMCCDMIYASDDSKFSLPEVNMGLVPGWGGAIRLPRKVTVNKAKEMILLGEAISADEAHMWGIVNRVFPKDKLFEEVDMIIIRLLDQPPLAIRGVKKIVSHGIVDGNIDNARMIEKELSISLMATHDFEEAIAAREQKRKPKFKGE